MVIEIITLTAIFYMVLRFLRSTRGFGILRGLAIFFSFAFLSFSILSIYPGVPVLGHLLKQVAPYLILILFILFQPELRQVISRFGRAGMFRFLNTVDETQQAIPQVVRAAQRRSKERIGALVAFERQGSLAPYRENAVTIEATVSPILVETLCFAGARMTEGRGVDGKGWKGKCKLGRERWTLGKCGPVNQEMLAGYLARTYEIELDSGFREAKGRIEDKLDSDVRSRIGGDVQRVHSIRTHYSAISFKHLLLPVWLLAYRYNEKVYQVMINAGTGEVQGERPYSWVKITLTVLAGVAVAVGVFFLVKS